MPNVQGNAERRSICIIEDEKKLLDFLSSKLENEGFLVVTCHDGVLAEKKLAENKFDLIILDLILPGKSGVEILSNIRKEGNQTPVLILSARGKVLDRIEGLTLGADDYLVKPFDFGELVARIKVILNRANMHSDSFLTACDLKMDLVNRRVSRAGKIIELSNKEFELLKYLLQNPNEVITSTMLIEHVWGYDFPTGTNIVNVYINYLRNLVDEGFEKKIIRTIRGKGFMLVDK